MDVGDDRHRRVRQDVIPQRLDVLLARHGDAHDVGASLGDALDLRERLSVVGRLRLRHRLHRDGGAAANGDAADVDLTLRSHGTHSTEPPRPAMTLA